MNRGISRAACRVHAVQDVALGCQIPAILPSHVHIYGSARVRGDTAGTTDSTQATLQKRKANTSSATATSMLRRSICAIGSAVRAHCGRRRGSGIVEHRPSEVHARALVQEVELANH